MAKKYYLSPVVGTGSEDDPVRLKVADYYGNHTAVLSSSGWGIALVSDHDHSASLGDPDVHPFPDVPLDTLISDLPAETVARIDAFLVGYGISTAGATLRSVLVDFSTLMDGNFELSRFGVGD